MAGRVQDRRRQTSCRLAKAWGVGDKTGGGHGTSNDVAVIWPVERPPVVITAYLTESAATYDTKNVIDAAIVRAIAGVLQSPVGSAPVPGAAPGFPDR